MSKRPERALVWVAAALTFAAMAMLTGFFSFGLQIPTTIDMNPGLYSQLPYHFPPRAWFNNNYWLGQMQMPQDFQPMSLLAHLPMWMFFSGYYALFGALSLGAFYAFLRELNFRRGVAVVGGVLYAWQGDFLSNLMAGHFSCATVWWLFALAAWLAVRCGHRRDWLLAALCGVCTGMMVSLLPDRGGLCSLVIAGLFAVALWRGRGDWPESLRHVGRLALVVVVAGAVAWPGIWTNLSWATVKAHQSGAETAEQKYQWATQWSYTPEDVLNYIVPGFFGWRTGYMDGPYWGRIGRSWTNPQTPEGRNFCLAIFTIGTVGFLLAVAGTLVMLPRWRRHQNESWLDDEQMSYARFALAVVILGWLLALGKYGPLFEWFYQLPYMDTWRNPLKFLAPVSLVLIVLSACGAQVLARLLEKGSEAEAARASVQTVLRRILLGLAAGIVISFPARMPISVYMVQLQYLPDEVNGAVSTLRAALVVAALVVGLLWFWWWRLSLPTEQRRCEFINPLIQKAWDQMMLNANLGRTWLVWLAVAVVVQMLWVQSHYSELIYFKAFYGSSALTKKLKKDGEVARVSVEMSDPLLRQVLSTVFPYNRIQSLDIPAASRIPDDYEQFFSAVQTNRARLQQLGGVKHWVCSAAAIPSIQEEPGFRGLLGPISYYTIDPSRENHTATHAIVELKNYLPKALVVTGRESFGDDESLLKRLVDEKWNPFASVLVRQEDGGDVASVRGTTNPGAEAKLLHYDDQRIEVRARSTVPATLLIDDRYESAWKATVNGKPAKVFPANFILRGVTIPAGESTVVLTYEVPMNGHYIQLAVLALVTIWALVRVMTRRREPSVSIAAAP